MPDGSRLVFLNRLDPETFANRMKGGNFEKSLEGGWEQNGVVIQHTEGDSATKETLRAVLANWCFEAAIVMGSLAGKGMRPKFRA